MGNSFSVTSVLGSSNWALESEGELISLNFFGANEPLLIHRVYESKSVSLMIQQESVCSVFGSIVSPPPQSLVYSVADTLGLVCVFVGVLFGGLECEY